MLTDLSFLQPGRPWPPPCEKERLRRYAYNRALFANDCDDKYREQAKRIERVIGEYREVVSYHIALNYPKRISVKTADLLLGEPPKWDAGEQTGTLDKIAARSALIGGSLREAVLDISMCGDGLLYIRRTEQGAIIDTVAPDIWFPVVSPNNIKEIVCHVLAWQYSVTEGERTAEYLRLVIHDRGQYTERTHMLDSGTIGKMVGEERTTPTGLDDFAVLHIPNTTTSRSLYGMDDYTDIDSIVSELEVRIDQIARVLDKHTDPTMQGPRSALIKDAAGNYVFPAGNYVINQDENGNTANVGYLTWDAQLAANFALIDKLIDQLYTQSEMGAAIFGDVANKSGSIPSGTALRRMMISPLAKVSRIREKLDPALKKAFRLAAKLDGVTVGDISVTRQDGLPDDPKESAEIMQIRTGNKATISQYSAIQMLDGRTDPDTAAELDLIRQDDEAMLNGTGAVGDQSGEYEPDASPDSGEAGEA